MRRVFDILEAAGFISEEDLPPMAEPLTEDSLLRVNEELFQTVFAAQNEGSDTFSTAADPFTFVASASMRADSSCTQPSCRTRKLDFLGRFAALYGNEVTVPLPLRRNEDEESSLVAEAFYKSTTTLLRLRPLIDSGLVRPVTMYTSHCEHVALNVRKLKDFLIYMGSQAAKEWGDQFQLEYQLPRFAPSGRSTVYLTGPDDLIEHGNMVFLFDERPSWRLKSWRFDSEGRTGVRGVRKTRFIEKVLEPVLSNTSFYLAYGYAKGARLLTDLAGEAYFLEMLTTDETVRATSDAMKLLDHAIPLLPEQSLGALVRMRKEERDSFESYRAAVTEIAKEVLETSELTKEDARDLFKSKLEPRLLKLEKEISSETKRQRRRLVGAAGSLAAAISIGMFKSLPMPVDVGLVVAATSVATSLLPKAVASICEHGSDLRERNDLYFLARMRHQSSRQSS